MKQIFLFLFISCIFFISCSDDNGNENTPTVLPEIKIHKDKIGVGQFILGECKPLGNDTLGFTYNWDADNGTIKKSNDYTCSWIPQKKGSSTISVTVTRGKEEVSKSTKVNVVDCDFELALWGDHMADILINEYFINNQQSEPEVSLELGLILFPFARTDLIIGYFSDKNAEVVCGISQTTKKYGIENQKYVEDYNREKEKLISLYGTPKTDEVKWIRKPSYINPGNENEPLMQGVAIGGGYLTLEATFDTPNSEISVICQGKNSRTYTSTVYISKKYAGQNKSRSIEESFINKLIDTI